MSSDMRAVPDLKYLKQISSTVWLLRWARRDDVSFSSRIP